MKHSKIEEILKKLTSERIEQEVKTIQEIKLPVELQKWVEEYESVGKRDRFIWKWLYVINKIWFYSSVQKKYLKSLANIKTLYNMFVVLLDDVAEEKNTNHLLGELLKIPFNPTFRVNSKQLIDKEDFKYVKFTYKLWGYILKEIKKYPRYKDVEKIFYYDTAQFVNAVKYTNLIFNNPSLINTKEFWLYLPHSMQILIDLDLDLMCNLTWRDKELGRARHGVLLLQDMGRIGNWICTWKREAQSNDFTSAMVSYALDNNIINFDELYDKNELIKKIENSSVEKYLFKEWEKRYNQLNNISKGNKIINQKEITRKSKYLIFMHLISRGYK